MNLPKTMMAVAAFALAIGSAHANWTAEEKALLQNNSVVETYITSKPDSYQVG